MTWFYWSIRDQLKMCGRLLSVAGEMFCPSLLSANMWIRCYQPAVLLLGMCLVFIHAQGRPGCVLQNDTVLLCVLGCQPISFSRTSDHDVSPNGRLPAHASSLSVSLPLSVGKGLQENLTLVPTAIGMKIAGVGILVYMFAALVCAAQVGEVRPMPNVRLSVLAEEEGVCRDFAGNR